MTRRDGFVDVWITINEDGFLRVAEKLWGSSLRKLGDAMTVSLCHRDHISNCRNLKSKLPNVQNPRRCNSEFREGVDIFNNRGAEPRIWLPSFGLPIMTIGFERYYASQFLHSNSNCCITTPRYRNGLKSR
jgi:hypothetical protein